MVLMAALTLMRPAAANDAGDRLAHAFKASLEETGALPMDPALYASRISVSHNWDLPKIFDRAQFVAELAEERPLIAAILGKARVTRLITASDTIVATVEYPEARVEGEAPPQIAFFLRFADGKLVEEQVFADRGQLQPLIDALRSANEERARVR